MNVALPEATVTGCEKHMPTVELPDPYDQHVVAAAMEAGASMIVRWNLRDFPVRELRKHGLACQSPDAFLVGLHEQAPDMLTAALANARHNLSQSRISASGFIDILRDQRLTKLAARMEKHVGDV